VAQLRLLARGYGGVCPADELGWVGEGQGVTGGLLALVHMLCRIAAISTNHQPPNHPNTNREADDVTRRLDR